MADRYWVSGGTGNYNSTTNWSDTSGGASGASVPTASDAVFFDSNSGAGTAIINVASLALSLNTTGFNGTLRFNSNLTVSGDVTIGVSTNFSNTSGTPTLTVDNDSNLTSNGVTFPYRLALGGAGVTHTLIDNWTVGNLLFNTSGGVGRTINGNKFFITGSIVGASVMGNQIGTTKLEMIGTGELSNGNGIISLDIEINTLGVITIGRSFQINLVIIGGELRLTSGTVDAGFYNNSQIRMTEGSSIVGFDNNPLGTFSFIGTSTIGCNLYIEGMVPSGSGAAGITNKSGDFAIYISRIFSNSGGGTRTCNIPIYFVGGDMEWIGGNYNTVATEGFFIRGGNLLIRGSSSLSVAPTEIRFTGMLVYESGRVVVADNTIFVINGNSTLMNMHKIAFNNIQVGNGVTLTMNEFFCGLPNRSTFILNTTSTQRFTVVFDNDRPRYARYVSMRRMVLPDGQRLTITTPQNFFRSNTNNQTTTNNDRQPNATIIYTNTTPNGAPVGLNRDPNYASSYVPNAITHTDPNCFTTINLD
jgi:hypothetical protein